jgi:glutaredoxin 3
VSILTKKRAFKNIKNPFKKNGPQIIIRHMETKKNKTLELYYFDECPFCVKVLTYLKSNPKELTFKNIKKNPEYKDHLIKVGGKSQVPCLFIDGTPLYESSDIIKWLQDN